MRKSKWWIFILLTSFILLLVPKSIWHDCEQKHFLKKLNGTEYKVEKEHCNICDFQFYPSIIQDEPIFFYAKNNFQTKLVADYQIIFVSPILLSPRGPPANLF